MKHILFVISGPSGVGKGTMVQRLLKEESLALSVSCTTRAPRAGEVNGKSYFFMTRAEFEEKIRLGGFLEYDEHFGNYYGTPRAFVEEQLQKGSVLLEIDVVGALNVKKSFREAVLIFLAPPDEETLKQRLKGRDTESQKELSIRLERAAFELSQANKFDYFVINGDADQTVRTLRNILSKEENRTM